MEIEKIVNAQSYFSGRNTSYKKSFINAFKNVNNKYLEKKLLAKFCNKDQFLQSLMEVIIYRHFCSKEFTLDFDKCINNQSKKDVDIVACKNNITLNIEVKCPVTEEKSENEIVLRQDHRYSNSKEDNIYFSTDMENLKNEMNCALNKANIKKQISIKKMQDNKLKDYLFSANEKFNSSNDNELNVLFLCLTTSEFMLFLDYMINKDTGLFSSNSYVDPKHFEKIDCFVLSNIKSGHNKCDLESCDKSFDIWNINKYVNFIIPNIAKYQEIGIQIPKSKEKLFLESLHDSYFHYCLFEKNFVRKHPNIPRILHIVFPEYISNYFPLLTKEYQGKIEVVLDDIIKR